MSTETTTPSDPEMEEALEALDENRDLFERIADSDLSAAELAEKLLDRAEEIDDV